MAQLTSRRKRPLDRSIPHERDTRLIIIAAEGEQTERQYFESELFGNRRVQVRVLPPVGGRSSPNWVYERLRAFAKQTQLHSEDQLWLVVDKDRFQDRMLSEVCSRAVRGKRLRVRLAISNPCFELWLYLHYAEWHAGQYSSSRDMKKAHREQLGGYNSSNLNIDNYRDRVDLAVQNAQKLDSAPSSRWPQNPGTHIPRLIAAIRELGSVTE